MNNMTNQTENFPNTKNCKIFQLGKIKLGVIGLTTVETPFSTNGDLTDLKFLEYKEIINTYLTFLRRQGANAVILNAHIGTYCKNNHD